MRQLAHRARRHVRARHPRFETDRDGQHQVTERFLAACRGGDMMPGSSLTDETQQVCQAMRQTGMLSYEVDLCSWAAETLLGRNRSYSIRVATWSAVSRPA